MNGTAVLDDNLDGSGPRPDLIADQRSRDGVSSVATTSGRQQHVPQNPSVPTALYTPGSTQLTLSSLLHATDVAAMLGVSKPWVYAEVRAGRMPHVRLGRYVRFRKDSIEQWLREIEAGRTR